MLRYKIVAFIGDTKCVQCYPIIFANLHRNTPKPQQQLQEIKYHTLSLILFPNYSRCLHYNRCVHKYTFIVLHLVFLEEFCKLLEPFQILNFQSEFNFCTLIQEPFKFVFPLNWGFLLVCIIFVVYCFSIRPIYHFRWYEDTDSKLSPEYRDLWTKYLMMEFYHHIVNGVSF